MLGGRRTRKRHLYSVDREVSAAFPIPECDDDGQWDVYVLVEEAQAAIAGGLRREGFGTAAFNACMTALDELLEGKSHLLDAQQHELIHALRQAVVDLA